MFLTSKLGIINYSTYSSASLYKDLCSSTQHRIKFLICILKHMFGSTVIATIVIVLTVITLFLLTSLCSHIQYLSLTLLRYSVTPHSTATNIS